MRKLLTDLEGTAFIVCGIAGFALLLGYSVSVSAVLVTTAVAFTLARLTG